MTTTSTTTSARGTHRGAIAGALGLLALAPLVHPAHAGVTYDASLAAPGVYFGTGNANAGFTVSTANSVELGLSAITRYTGPITPVGDVYHAALGNAVPPTTGTAWGVDFSINLRAGGGSLTLGNVDAVLTVTDEGTGFNTTITDFLGFLPDNTCYNGSVTSCSNSSDYGVQNSEPASLFAAIGDTNFNNFVPDTYDHHPVRVRLRHRRLRNEPARDRHDRGADAGAEHHRHLRHGPGGLRLASSTPPRKPEPQLAPIASPRRNGLAPGAEAGDE